MDKRVIVLHDNYKKYFDKLNAEETKEVLNGLFAYMNESEKPKLNGITEMVYDLIIDNTRLSDKRYKQAKKYGGTGGKKSKKQAELADKLGIDHEGMGSYELGKKIDETINMQNEADEIRKLNEVEIERNWEL